MRRWAGTCDGPAGHDSHERQLRLVAHHLPRTWLRAWHVDGAASATGGRAGAWLGAWLARYDGPKRQERLVESLN